MQRVARNSLRDQVRESLVEAIGAGEWKPGERVPLDRVAEALRVSVTPVREALTQLEHEGLVVSEPARGFFVSSVTSEEAREVYPVLAVLEGLAVQLAPADALRLKTLRDLGARLRSVKSSSEAQRLDRMWHETVAGGSGNRTLEAKLSELRRRVALVEAAYMGFPDLRERSLRQHEEIIELVEADERSAAARRLKDHWELSLEFISE